MIIDKFEQQPRDVRVRNIDYSEFLGSGDELDATPESAPTVEVALHAGDADDSGSPFQVYGVAIDSTTVLSYYATGGASGNTYKATFLTNTVNGQTHESEILFRIKEY